MIFGFNDLLKGVHWSSWVGLRGFFWTQPTIVGFKKKKKIQPTQPIIGVQLNPHGMGWVVWNPWVEQFF